VRAGAAFVEFFAKGNDKVQAVVADMQARMKRMAATVAMIGAVTVGIGTAITAPFLRGLEIGSQWTNELVSGARRTGMSFEAVGALAYALNTDIDGLAGATRKMNSFLEEAAHGSADANAR